MAMTDYNSTRLAGLGGILPRSITIAQRKRAERDAAMYELHAEAIRAGLCPSDAQATAERIARTSHRSIRQSIEVVRGHIRTTGGLGDGGRNRRP